MFTGIITDIGEIVSAEKQEGLRLKISTKYNTSEISMGASIACSGVCLTVVKKGKGWFLVDVSGETLACTTIAEWKAGKKINLERALKLGDELGGHIVSGHVDGLGVVREITKTDESYKFVISVPDSLKYYIAAKGSVAIDGISLTVNLVEDNEFTVNIIPHTWQQTTLNSLKISEKVNIEVDMLARYVARLNQK